MKLINLERIKIQMNTMQLFFWSTFLLQFLNTSVLSMKGSNGQVKGIEEAVEETETHRNNMAAIDKEVNKKVDFATEAERIQHSGMGDSIAQERERKLAENSKVNQSELAQRIALKAEQMHAAKIGEKVADEKKETQASKVNDNDLVKKIKPMAERKQNIGLDPLKNKDLRGNVNTGTTDAELQASKILAKTKGMAQKVDKQLQQKIVQKGTVNASLNFKARNSGKFEEAMRENEEKRKALLAQEAANVNPFGKRMSFKRVQIGKKHDEPTGQVAAVTDEQKAVLGL